MFSQKPKVPISSEITKLFATSNQPDDKMAACVHDYVKVKPVASVKGGILGAPKKGKLEKSRLRKHS